MKSGKPGNHAAARHKLTMLPISKALSAFPARGSTYTPTYQSPRKPIGTRHGIGGRHSRYVTGNRAGQGASNVATKREIKREQAQHHQERRVQIQRNMVAQVNESTRQKLLLAHPGQVQLPLEQQPGTKSTTFAAAAESEKRPRNQYTPHAKVPNRWYSRRNPNAVAGDRNSYLRPAEVGSLRLTIHSSTAPHSQSPQKRAKMLQEQREKQNEINKRRIIMQEAEDKQMLSMSVEDTRLKNLREDAQRKLRHKRAHALLHMLRQRLKQHPSLARVFKTWDTDNSGTLTIGEMQKALHMLNVSVEDAAMKALFSLFDDDHSGEIEAKEFIDAIQHGDTFLADHKKGQAQHDAAASAAKTQAAAARLSTRPPMVHNRDKKEGQRDDDDVDATRLTHAMRYLRDRFRHSKRSALIKLLQQYDEDGDGCIDANELQHVFLMMNIPLTPAETTILIETQFDKDGDGAVDYNEFIDRLKESNDADWEKLFDVFETEFKRQKLRAKEVRLKEEELMRRQGNKGGLKLKTTRERVEMSPALRNVVLANMGSIIHGFERFDIDGDGVLDREEFGSMLEHFGRRKDDLKLTRQDVDMIFHYFDKDGDGELEMKEIINTMYYLGQDARAGGASSHHGSHAMYAALECNNFFDLPVDDPEIRKAQARDREIQELAAKKSYRRFGSDTRVSIYDGNDPPGGRLLPTSQGTFPARVISSSLQAGPIQRRLPDPLQQPQQQPEDSAARHDPTILVYRDRQKFLKNWQPSPAQQEKIRLAVQFSADNHGR